MTIKKIIINEKLSEKRGTHIKWKIKVSEDGKESITEVKPLHHFFKNGITYTLVLCKPLTGRQHQIRVHLKHSKHPIVGDKIYIAEKKEGSGDISYTDTSSIIYFKANYRYEIRTIKATLEEVSSSKNISPHLSQTSAWNFPRLKPYNL